MKLIICDDLTEKVDFIERFLNSCGITEIVRTKCGNELLEQLQTTRFDLVLLDMTFPLESGSDDKEALAGVRILYYIANLEKTPPVIILTQYCEFRSGISQSPSSTSLGKRSLLYINSNYRNEIDMFAYTSKNNNNYANLYQIEGLHTFLSETFSCYLGMIYMCGRDQIWQDHLKELMQTF